MGKPTVGQIIKKARLDRNFTQEGLAWVVDVSGVTVSRWERDEQRPKPCQREKLAAHLSGPKRTYRPEDFAGMSLPTPELDDETIDQLRRLLFPNGITKARRAMAAPKTPAPLCECGCGEPVKSNKNGIWSRYRPGHSNGRGSGRPVTGNSPRNLERKQAKARKAS